MTKVHTHDGKLGFRIHALVFAATTALLLVVDVWAGGPLWIHWVLIGWAPGLLAHWVFGPMKHNTVAV